MAMIVALKFRHQCRMMKLPDCGVGIELNIERPEKPAISGGSDKQRLVAVQIGPDGIEWCHHEPSISS